MLSKFSEKRDFSIFKKSCVSQEISSKAESIIKEVGNKVVQKDKINFDGRDQIERLFLEIKSIQE